MANLVGIILIATGKYNRFIQPLLDSADKFFFEGKNVDVYLFADKEFRGEAPARMSLIYINIPHLPWPYPTLYRYKWITENKNVITSDYVFYMDVDMLFVGKVDSEIIPTKQGLTAVRHPGFHARGGWGDNKTTVNSTAYMHPSLRKTYYAGGFQGGQRDMYLLACEIMAKGIATDEGKCVVAGWQDESHWNCYLWSRPHLDLTPSYCMVEEMELRVKWLIATLQPKILALKKNHQELRS